MEASMRSNRPIENQALINELKQGRELAKQLKNHLNPSTASSETRQFLVEKIISSYEKTLTKLNRSNDSSVLTSLNSKSDGYNNSPRSQGSNHQLASKKRKALPKWTEHVEVKSETGLEGPLDDGHGWRKYGQKDILGAIHPRGYYRCTHRHVQGCLATKQVQRSDQDPTVFHIMYKGQHTCTKAAAQCPSTDVAKVIKPVPNTKRTKLCDDQFRFSFGSRNRNENNSLVEQVFPTFSSFGYTSGNKNKADDYVFISSAEAEEDHQFMMSPFYMSPATSDSDFFSPCQMGLSQLNVHRSESDLAEAGSCVNSVSNSPMGVLDFPTGCGSAEMDFDSSFLFGFFDFE
ncbi:unnamed protein product [Rhodiola kirilowii]